MKKIIPLFAVMCSLPAAFYAQYVGIGTENPTAMLDINGDVVYRIAENTVEDSITLALDINTEKFSCYRISGADSSFTIAGITAGMDGREVTLINESGFPMILNHEDTSAAAGDRIITGDHADLILNDMGMVTLQYDTSSLKWLVKSSNLVPQESVWDTAGTNIFFDNFVGIGTEDPTSPLSIETGVDELGFSHMAGIDSITVASSVSALTGSVGTTTDHVFSLNAGGQGKVHIWPNGNVAIGEESEVGNLMENPSSRMNPFDSKLTVYTPLNETGFTHIGGDSEIIVDEAIGGVSASIGTMTNHNFRLKTNGLTRLHVNYDGNVGIGTIFPSEKLVVQTPADQYGISHRSDDGVVLTSHVGTVSASFGTASNHNFRLVTNGLSRLHINYDGNVGIGTISPYEKLTVQTPASSYGISHRSDEGIVVATHVGAVSASIGTFSVHNFRLVTSGLPRLNITYDGKVGIGTISPVYLFEVNGTMRSKEVIVETLNWPDYVFEQNYKRHTLSELENFIQQHHHLPNIPSAKEIEENGQHLGELQKKMMEKIEELTLHILELHKRIESLELSNKQN